MIIVIVYCIMHECIEEFNSATLYAIKFHEVVIEVWLGSYRRVE